MSMAGYIADSEPVGLFSLEMSDNENMIRLIAMNSGIPYQDLKQGQFKKNDEQARAYTNALSAAELARSLILDDSPAIGIAELKAKSRRLLERAPDQGDIR